MKILEVAPAYPPSAYGGISTHVSLISRELATRGHEVHVATTNRYDVHRTLQFHGPRGVDGVVVYYARAHWPGRYFFAPGILAILEKWTPEADVVHIHDTRTFVGLAAYVAARNSRIPYVVTCHGSLSTRVGDIHLKVIHDKVFGQALVKNAAKVIVVSRRERADIIGYGVDPGRVVIIPDTIPLSPTEPDPLMNSAREGPRKTILYLGRLHRIKGVDRLVDAFALLARREHDCELAIAGQDFGFEASLRRQVRNLGIADRVRFLGPIYGEAKDNLLGNADVVVVPSRYEVFSFVILESMAAGVPLIVTRECGIAEDSKEGGAALVVSTPTEMARAISECLHDARLRERLRDAGRELLRTTYGWESALRMLTATYLGAIGRWN